MATNKENINEVVINDDQLICRKTNQIKKATDKELALQSMISMLTDEYGFALSDIERDFSVRYDDSDTGKSKSKKVGV